MSSDAPGQFLGFCIEIPRALFHLLNSGPGDIVSVEFFGDVSKTGLDSFLTTEEDKSSINSNPVTDKSTDLWKTFFNWITEINDQNIVLSRTRFILYTNYACNKGIVKKFSEAITKDEVTAAIDFAKNKLSDIDSEHEIWKYYDFVVNQNQSVLEKLLLRFELQVGKGAGYEEVNDALIRKHIHAGCLDFLRNELVGWLHKELVEKIKAKLPPRIFWENFDKSSKFYLK